MPVSAAVNASWRARVRGGERCAIAEGSDLLSSVGGNSFLMAAQEVNECIATIGKLRLFREER